MYALVARGARLEDREGRTASEEAVLGEDGDGVDDEDNNWRSVS